MREWDLPEPVAWITSVGTEIYWPGDNGLFRDEAFDALIAQGWDALGVKKALADVPGLVPQAPYEQRQFKRSYFITLPDTVAEVKRRLARAGLVANVIVSHETLLDVVPVRAGKGAAMRHISTSLRVPMGVSMPPATVATISTC